MPSQPSSYLLLDLHVKRVRRTYVVFSIMQNQLFLQSKCAYSNNKVIIFIMYLFQCFFCWCFVIAEICFKMPIICIYAITTHTWLHGTCIKVSLILSTCLVKLSYIHDCSYILLQLAYDGAFTFIITDNFFLLTAYVLYEFYLHVLVKLENTSTEQLCNILDQTNYLSTIHIFSSAYGFNAKCFFFTDSTST